jgi:hypothetical protein
MRSVFASIVGVVTAWSIGAAPVITHQDQIAVQRSFEDGAEKHAKAFLQTKGLGGTEQVSASAVLGFNTKRLADEYEQYKKKEEEKLQLYLLTLKDALKPEPAIESTPELEENLQEDQEDSSEKKDGKRLGMLNLDISSLDFRSLFREKKTGNLERAPKESNAQLHYAIPDMSRIGEGFRYSALQYLEQIDIVLQIPSGLKDEWKDELQKLIFQSLNLAAYVKKDAKSVVALNEIEVLVVAEEEIKEASFVDKLLDPQQGPLGILISALIVALLMFLGVRGLAKSVESISKGLAELKPAEAASNDESGGEAQVQASTPVEAEQEKGQNSDAVAAEMGNIRQQITQFVSQAPSTAADILRDMLYGEDGLPGMRHFIAFVGYDDLKPAMDKLPPSVRMRVSVYLDENIQQAPDMIKGAEFAQKVYQKCVSQLAKLEEKASEEFKMAITTADDQQILKAFESMSADEIGCVLQALSLDRANHLAMKMEAEKLKEAIPLLDKKFDNIDELQKSIMAKLGELADMELLQVSKTTRLIMRLVRTAKIADEDKIISMLDPKDIELRRKIMSEKFLYSDLSHLEGAFLRKVLDSFPTSFRASFIFISVPEIKEKVLAEYQEGSKIREMLQDEITEIEENETKKIATIKQSTITLETFMVKLRQMLRSDDDAVDGALNVYAKSVGVELKSAENAAA